MGPHDRHIPCVIARAVFLFVRTLMTLVDDDQTEICNRCKDRAAGSHRQFDFSIAQSFMVNGTLGIREHRMQNRNGTETLSKSFNCLRRQGDLRQ